jgi:N-acetylglutamate synthase-like GNAT family acetyltransferase
MTNVGILKRMHQITIRPAEPTDDKALEAVQWRASLNNPGDREALLANPEAIELPLQQVESDGVFIAEKSGSIMGFAAIPPRSDGDYELDALFVEPETWRQGVGRALVEHCCLAAKGSGARAVHVVGIPHAEGFYEACGFKQIGRKQMRFGIGLLMKRALQ